MIPVSQAARSEAKTSRSAALAAGMTAGILVLASITLLVWFSRQSQTDAVTYVLILAAGSAAVPMLVHKAQRIDGRAVFALAVLLHMVALAGVPAFEDDYYRFIWDGWVSLSQGTPYGTAPAAFYGSSIVPAEMQGILDGVNNPDVPTIYGPVLQILFLGTHAIAGSDLTGLKIAFAIVNLVLIAVLLRSHPAQRVALYAWNPFVITEIVLHVHPDGVMVAMLVAGIALLHRYPLAAGLFFAGAAGAKLVALAAWPILLRSRGRAVAIAAAIVALTGAYAFFAARGGGLGLDATSTFAREWLFNPLGFDLLQALIPGDLARLAAAAIATFAIIWLHSRAGRSLENGLVGIFGVVLLFAPAVNPWYLLWLLPFAIRSRMIWPFAACVALPFSYLTGYNLDDAAIDPFAVHGVAKGVELAILAAALAWDMYRARGASGARIDADLSPQIAEPRTAVIIPALNEALSVGPVVIGLSHVGIPGLATIIVVDNGSNDDTATIARKAGARVVHEPVRGYGQACLTGLAHLPDDINLVLFADADGADEPTDAVRLVADVASGHADMAIGSRMLGQMEAGAMTPPQRFGNWLAPALIRIIWGMRFTDLGPLRAIRRDALERLCMTDRDFGWTVEMQVRAARIGLVCTERPARYRRRIGVSKISGTLSGVMKAGTKILFVVAREAFVAPPFDRPAERPGSLAPDRSITPCVA